MADRTTTEIKWRQSISGLIDNAQSFVDAVEAELGEDFMFEHQPRLLLHGLQMLAKNLGELRANPDRHTAFFEHYIDLPGDEPEPNEVPRG